MKNVHADIVLSSGNETLQFLYGTTNIGDFKLVPKQDTFYNVFLFTEESGSKFPYYYKAGDTFYAAAQDDKANSSSSVTWELDAKGIPTITGGIATIQISVPLASINGTLNAIQFFEGNADFTSLEITAYNKAGNAEGTWTLPSGFNRHAFLYNNTADENGGIAGMFGEETESILIRLQITQSGGINANGTDGNLWAGHIYFLGSGTASPFSEQWTASPKSAVTPEPATLLICGFGLAGLAAARRRKKKCVS